MPPDSPYSTTSSDSPTEAGQYGSFSSQGSRLGTPRIGDCGGGSPRPISGLNAGEVLHKKSQVKVNVMPNAYHTSNASYGGNGQWASRDLYTRAGRSTDTEYLNIMGSTGLQPGSMANGILKASSTHGY